MEHAIPEVFYHRVLNTSKCHILNALPDSSSQLSCFLISRPPASDVLWPAIQALFVGCLGIPFLFSHTVAELEHWTTRVVAPLVAPHLS